MDKHLPNFKNCRQYEPPFCRAVCPFHLDIHDFVEKIQRGAFNAAYTLYKNAVVFPEIACSICHEPCRGVCPLKDQSIRLRDLERAVVAHATKKKPPEYNLPLKNKSIAVIGAGLSGLACALRLATKKYRVTVFERSERRGGHLWNILNPDRFIPEIAFQFQHEECDFVFQRNILSLEELIAEEYDAIYVATGKHGLHFGLLDENLTEPCFMKGEVGIFGGGSMLGHDSSQSLEDGVKMSTTIDNFLKTGNLIYTPDKSDTSMVLTPARLIHSQSIQPTGPSVGYGRYSADNHQDFPRLPIISGGDSPDSKDPVYTKDEAMAEAARCLECRCDACMLYNDLLAFNDKLILRVRDEIQATTFPGTSEVKATPAKRLISTSTFDGLCKSVCPEGIDLDGLILEARKSMHRQDKLAWVFNEFWLRDMDHANGPASLVKAPPGDKTCEYAFFPGCQLSASDPNLITATYRSLLNIHPSTGLILSCCGIPAEWAGNDDLRDQSLSRVQTEWQSIGEPTLILACPTCATFFEEHLPHIKTVSLYEQLLKNTETSFEEEPVEGTYSVFDPCKTGGQDELRSAVRSLATEKGCKLVPLPQQEEFSGCCSYGGQGSIAEPELAKFIIERRISERNNPYITYCINCRDAFRSEGKEAFHILEVLYGKSKQHLPTVTARRENRLIAKESVLKEFWKEETILKREGPDIQLIISPDLKEKLSKERILESDVASVIHTCHEKKRTIHRPEKGTFSCYGMVGHMTLWVEYRKNEEAFVLVNAYTHRMKIEMEAVWNGVKREDVL